MKRLSSRHNANLLFFVVFLCLFFVINLGYFLFLSFSFSFSFLVYAWLLEFAAIGLAYELTGLLLNLLLRELVIPRVENLKAHPPVALLCVTCDDADPNVLKNLKRQTYPNLQIFVLDDSQHMESRSIVDSSNLMVIRRSSKVGYKAGNLNHWLFLYGSQFSFFVVADADSLLPDDFVEKMICYAEHPENCNVAIFESLIDSWNKENEFVRLQSVMIPLYHRHRLRVDNRFESTLSVGHNNLYRTSAVMNVGGFKEKYIGEDYTTSIEILKGRKWLCKTVPLTSYERLPANLSEHAKRQARWAFQNFQLMDLNISGLPWSVRLKIFMELHQYMLPVVGSIGMILLVYSAVQNYLFFSPFAISPKVFETLLRSKFFWFWVAYLLFPTLLRLILILREGASTRQYFKSALFHSAISVATMWPVIRRLVTLWTGDRLGFNVTGRTPFPSFRQIIRIGWPGFMLVWIALLAVVLNPAFGWLNLVWILPASLSPLLIHSYQKPDPK